MMSSAALVAVRVLGAEGQDADAEGELGRMRQLVAERRHADAGLDDREDHAAERLRQIGEFEARLAGLVVEEVAAGGGVGVQRGEVARR